MRFQSLKEETEEQPTDAEDWMIDAWIMDNENDKLIQYFENNPSKLNKNTKTNNNNLLNFSIYNDNKGFFDFLLKKKVRLRTDKHGYTAMHQAVFAKDLYFMKALSEYGADINEGNKKNGTPLTVLIDNIVNGKGGTGASLSGSQQIERSKEYVDMLKLMISLGADIDVEFKGQPLINELIGKSIQPLVQVMLEHEPSLIQKYDGFKRALIAINNTLVEYLIDNFPAQLEKSAATIDDIEQFMKHGLLDVTVKLYALLSAEEKQEFRMDFLLDVKSGEEKILMLLDRDDVVINSWFVKSKNVIALADKIRKTKAAEQIGKLAAEFGIIELMPEEVQDIFVF